jgi:hypothetical protein
VPFLFLSALNSLLLICISICICHIYVFIWITRQTNTSSGFGTRGNTKNITAGIIYIGASEFIFFRSKQGLWTRVAAFVTRDAYKALLCHPVCYCSLKYDFIMSRYECRGQWGRSYFVSFALLSVREVHGKWYTAREKNCGLLEWDEVKRCNEGIFVIQSDELFHFIVPF